MVLRPISAASARAVLAGEPPPDVRVAADHPTEFSAGIAAAVGGRSRLGPFFIHRWADEVVIGEIGGGFVAPGTVEIGYAIVASRQGQGHATAAVRALLELARALPEVSQAVASTPLDRPASGRVLAKTGFTLVGERSDAHDGRAIRVHRWQLDLRSQVARSQTKQRRTPS